MAKSKLVKANKKIEEAVVGTYQKIETGVVGAYQKIEDKFVDQYLTHDGESVEDAKKRIQEEKIAREAEDNARLEANLEATRRTVEKNSQ